MANHKHIKRTRKQQKRSHAHIKARKPEPFNAHAHERAVLAQTIIPAADEYGHPLPPLRNMAAALHEASKQLQGLAYVLKGDGDKPIPASHVYALLGPALDAVYDTAAQLDDMQGVARAYCDVSIGEARPERRMVEVPADVFESVQSACTRLDALMAVWSSADNSYKAVAADITILLEPVYADLLMCYKV